MICFRNSRRITVALALFSNLVASEHCFAFALMTGVDNRTLDYGLPVAVGLVCDAGEQESNIRRVTQVLERALSQRNYSQNQRFKTKAASALAVLRDVNRSPADKIALTLPFIGISDAAELPAAIEAYSHQAIAPYVNTMAQTTGLQAAQAETLLNEIMRALVGSLE